MWNIFYRHRKREISDNPAGLARSKFFLSAFITSRLGKMVRNLFKLHGTFLTSPRAQLSNTEVWVPSGLIFVFKRSAPRPKPLHLRRNGITARRADAERTFIVRLRIPHYVTAVLCNYNNPYANDTLRSHSCESSGPNYTAGEETGDTTSPAAIFINCNFR